MTENIDYRFRGMDAGLDAASKRAAAGLAGIAREADQVDRQIQNFRQTSKSYAFVVEGAKMAARAIADVTREMYAQADAAVDRARANKDLWTTDIAAASELTDRVDALSEAFGRISVEWASDLANEAPELLSLLDSVVTLADRLVALDIEDTWISKFARLPLTITTKYLTDAAWAAGLLMDALAGPEDENRRADAVIERVNVATQAQKQAVIEAAAALDMKSDAEREAAASTRDHTEAARRQADELERIAKETSAMVAEQNAARAAAAAAADAERLAKIKEVAIEQQAIADAVALAEIEASKRATEQRRAQWDTAVSLTGTALDTLSGLMKEGSAAQAATQRLAALYQIAVSTQAAVSQALTLPFPINLGAAALVGGLGAAAAIKAASVPMPSFDRGGVVDGGPQFPGGTPRQRVAQVEDGEVILTRRQQQAMGGGGFTTVVLTLGARELKRVTVASGMLDGVQKRRGFGQRRYGG